MNAIQMPKMKLKCSPGGEAPPGGERVEGYYLDTGMKSKKEVLKVLLSGTSKLSSRQARNGDALLSLKLTSQDCALPCRHTIGIKTELASKGWTFDVSALDIKSKRDGTALIQAVAEGDPEIVQMLIDAGATVDLTVDNGNRTF